jgi:antitoxin ParD1/3/4/toxin ParE1/3/4
VSRFHLSAEARQDLRDIRGYCLDQGGPSLSLYIRGEILKQVAFLAENPGAGHGREDLTPLPVKFWPVFSYLIVYDPASKPMGVARIVHGNRDLRTLFERSPPRV